jgi:diaminopimelate epimerase
MDVIFFKMQGAGNDFVVIDNRNKLLGEEQLQDIVPSLCNRKYGIGADGVLLLQPDSEYDYQMVYKNADGSDAGMCGNGGRCIALYARSLGFGQEQSFVVHNSVYRAFVEDTDVTLHFPAQTGITRIYGACEDPVYQVYPGTEHIVLLTRHQNLEDDKHLINIGRELRYHELFKPAGTNVNFFSVIDEASIRVRTYERGVENLTLACGTGSVACAVTAHSISRSKKTECEYLANCDGGKLQIGFSFNPVTKNYSKISLKGPAQFVFKGSISI